MIYEDDNKPDKANVSQQLINESLSGKGSDLMAQGEFEQASRSIQ